jgi:SAM-dependent methyltransferase
VVDAFDLSPSNIEAAQAFENKDLLFFVHDLREPLPLQNQYDAIFNFFTSFGYFDDQQDNQKAFDTFLKTGEVTDRGLAGGPGHVLRFRVPQGVTVVSDLVRGEVEFANDTIEDFVLLRSNGSPMFLLANVVDDIEMRITHVVRAEEHLPNTPKQQMLWEA